VANGRTYYMEDVHRVGGIPALLGELRRGGLLHDDVHTVHATNLGDWLDEWDIRGGKASAEAEELWHAAPGGKRSSTAFSQSERWADLDVDAAGGCIRDVAHAYSKDGGLGVLRGDVAVGGAVVCESQDEAVQRILNKEVKEGDVVVIRYEGPKGGRACRRCCTRRRSSRAAASARPALSSRTAASRAAPRVCRSATSRRRPRR